MNTCVNQLSLITYDIYKFFDNWFEGRAIFLNNAKAFDKAWQKDITLKLKKKNSELLCLSTDFLKYREQSAIGNS